MRSNLLRLTGLAAAAAVLPACGSSSEDGSVPAPGLWARTYGGPSSDRAGARALAATPTSFAVAGSSANSSSACVLGLHLDGTVAWQKSYSAGGTELAGLDAAPGGGFIFAGSTSTMGAGGWDAWVVRLDGDGAVVWQKTFGGTADDYSYVVRATSDGGFVVLGTSRSFNGGPLNLWIIKLTSAGAVTWQKTLLNPTDQFATDIRETSGGGYIIAAISTVGPTGDDGALVRLNADGSLAWQKRYGTSTDTTIEEAWAVVPALDGGFLFAGGVQPVAGVSRAWVVKVDSTGALAWQKSCGGGIYEKVFAAEAKPDGTFLLGGVTEQGSASPGSRLWMLAIDGAGGILWQKKYGSGTGGQEAADLSVLSSGGCLVLGSTSSYGAGSYDLWALSVGPDGDCGALDEVTNATSAVTAATAATPALTLTNTAVVPANTGVVPDTTSHLSTSQAP
jgi:hypothetical protein